MPPTRVSITRPVLSEVYPGHCTLAPVATNKAAARPQQRVFDSRCVPPPTSKPAAAVRLLPRHWGPLRQSRGTCRRPRQSPQQSVQSDCCRGMPSLPITPSRLPLRAPRQFYSALPWQAKSGREIAEEAPSDGLTLEKDGVAVRRPASDDVGLIWAANR